MKILLSITNRKTREPILNRVAMNILGDANNLNNLISELNEIKNFANGEANKLKLALNEVDVSVEFKI